MSRANPGEGGGVTPSRCNYFVFEAMQPKFVQNYFGIRSISYDKKSGSN